MTVVEIQRRKRLLLFTLGMIAGLSWMIPFAIGLKAKERLDTTGSIFGHVKLQKPVYRTEQEEAELEERLDAETR